MASFWKSSVFHFSETTYEIVDAITEIYLTFDFVYEYTIG